MKTVKYVSELTGVSIRTLRYYDKIGLLKPARLSDAGYRLYDDKALEKLQEIMFFRELEIPLADIQKIMEDPGYDKAQILLVQKRMLERRRNRLNGIIELIDDVIKGGSTMNFEAFNDEDVGKIVDHVVGRQDEAAIEAIITRYGSLESFRESIAQSLKEEQASVHFNRLYGSKDKALEASLREPFSEEEMKALKDENDRIYWQFAHAKEADDQQEAMEAVEKLAHYSKAMFRLDNARYLLLKIAEDYLEDKKSPELLEFTEKKYGAGITEYIGRAIRRYYGE